MSDQAQAMKEGLGPMVSALIDDLIGFAIAHHLNKQGSARAAIAAADMRFQELKQRAAEKKPR